MQRSRKARKRAAAADGGGGGGFVAISGNNKKLRLYYKVTLSLVFLLWGVVFLLNLWISDGDNYTDGPGVPANESTWHEAKMSLRNGSSEVEFSHRNLEKSDLSTLTSNSNTKFCSIESSDGEKNENGVSSVDKPEIKTSALGDKLEKEGQVETSAPVTEKEAPKNEWQVEDSALGTKQEKEAPKSERLSHAAPLGLDEFKSRASSPKGKPITGRAGSITHRLETGGAEHNYASSSKGAKALAFNKEAKGGSNILGKDKDKYLRNPCSAEEKFVIIELSEETLVDTIEIANFEHHSSNFKDFELLGSLVYPTDKWISLGNFTAGNVKHAQRFILQDPKWVRYLKFNLLSHYGSEFYCTVSYVEVYGVDAVERMLEDLISDQDHPLEPEQPTTEPVKKILSADTAAGDDLYQDLVMKTNDDPTPEKSSVKSEVLKNSVPDAVLETRPQQAGRLPGDTVLKILMQKVRSLDLNLLILERYLEELNTRHGNIFKELDEEIAAKAQLLEKTKSDLRECADSNEVNTKDVAELVTWKSLLSLQMDNLVKDNAILRSEVERVLRNQRHIENKGVVIFVLSFFFGCLAVTKLFVDTVKSVFRTQQSRKFSAFFSSWLVLLLSCTLALVIISL